MKPQRAPAAFTLLEILATCGVLSVLLAISVPAFNHLGRAQTLTQAGNRVATLAKLARENAISQQHATALVVLQNPAAVGLFDLQRDPATGTATNWQPLGKWEILPSGTSIVSEFAKAKIAFPDTVQFRGSEIPSSDFAYVIFMPNGSTGSTASLTLKSLNAPDQGANTYDISIVTSTGHVKVTRK